MTDRYTILYEKIRDHLPYLSEDQLEKVYKVIFNKVPTDPTRIKMQACFMDSYQKAFNTSYYWNGAKDWANLRQIQTKIKKKAKTKDPEVIIINFVALLRAAYLDKWIRENYEVGIINSKFNTLVKNGKQFNDNTRKTIDSFAEFAKEG